MVLKILLTIALDTGQRDNFYDIARIVRKGNAVTPTGRILVVYNYFEHGGDFFTLTHIVLTIKKFQHTLQQG